MQVGFQNYSYQRQLSRLQKVNFVLRYLLRNVGRKEIQSSWNETHQQILNITARFSEIHMASPARVFFFKFSSMYWHYSQKSGLRSAHLQWW